MKELFDKLSAECSKITTRRYSTSFSLGIYFLSRHLREPIYGIYGFVRLADEIVDSFHTYDKKYLLAKFKNDCFEAIHMGISVNPILNTFQQVVNKYEIDHDLIRLFLKSMEMDLEPCVYNHDRYEEYILGSAEVVGLMCLKVFTNGDYTYYEQLKSAAMKLGAAFQKVNFLRDLKADFQGLSRSYFPNIQLKAFSNEDKATIEKEIEEDFRQALIGIRQLPASARKGVYLSYIYYKSLFNKIKGVSADGVMNGRIRISNGRKLGLMVDSMVRSKINMI